MDFDGTDALSRHQSVSRRVVDGSMQERQAWVDVEPSSRLGTVWLTGCPYFECHCDMCCVLKLCAYMVH